MNTIKNITVLGDGGWGTTLAIHLKRQGYAVTLWGPFEDYIEEMKRARRNTKFLPEVAIPDGLVLTSNLPQAIAVSELLVFAVPSKFSRAVLEQIAKSKVPVKSKIILSVTKGIDTSSMLRITQMIDKILKPKTVAALSGPNIAAEVVKGIPSTAVIACKNPTVAKALQKIFNGPSFRIYTNTDVAGVELGGGLKNIIALACGVCDGLGFGSNTKAAILTRGLSEMAHLGVKLGAKKETFFGLSGLGDLVTTSFNEKSRNRQVGERIGKGETAEQILSSMHMVAEGVETVQVAYKLGRKYKVPMPIIEETYNIFYKSKNPAQAVTDLMARKATSES